MSTEHDRMLASGVLDEPVTAVRRALWPAWAREHLKTCELCQRLIKVEGLDAALSREALLPALATVMRYQRAVALAKGARFGEPSRADRGRVDPDDLVAVVERQDDELLLELAD